MVPIHIEMFEPTPINIEILSTMAIVYWCCAMPIILQYQLIASKPWFDVTKTVESLLVSIIKKSKRIEESKRWLYTKFRFECHVGSNRRAWYTCAWCESSSGTSEGSNNSEFHLDLIKGWNMFKLWAQDVFLIQSYREGSFGGLRDIFKTKVTTSYLCFSLFDVIFAFDVKST